MNLPHQSNEWCFLKLWVTGDLIFIIGVHRDVFWEAAVVWWNEHQRCTRVQTPILSLNLVWGPAPVTVCLWALVSSSARCVMKGGVDKINKGVWIDHWEHYRRERSLKRVNRVMNTDDEGKKQEDVPRLVVPIRIKTMFNRRNENVKRWWRWSENTRYWKK